MAIAPFIFIPILIFFAQLMSFGLTTIHMRFPEILLNSCHVFQHRFVAEHLIGYHVNGSHLENSDR